METRGKKHEEKNPVGDKPDRFFLVVLVPLGQYRTDQGFGCTQRANECGHDEGLLVHHVPLRISQYRNMLNHVKLEDHIQIANLSRHHSALASKTNKTINIKRKAHSIWNSCAPHWRGPWVKKQFRASTFSWNPNRAPRSKVYFLHGP